MKQLISRSLVFITLAAVLPVFFSFKAPYGGEGFHILINNKLVLERYGSSMNDLKTLQLDQYPPNASFTIRYYHCGKVGKGRIVTLKDEANRIIKQWKFQDATDINNGVSCTVKEITDLQKKHAVINVYYASSELPNGRLLTTISTAAVVIKK